MKRKYLKIGLNLFRQDPSIVFDLFNSEKNNLNYLFWKPKLKFSNKLFTEIKKDIYKDDKEFLNFLKIIHNKILDLNYFGENIYHIILYLLIRKTKPKTVVEAGVSRGVSSLFILQALEDNNKGNLISIDLPLAEYEAGKKEFIKDGVESSEVGICVPNFLRNRWQLFLGDSKKELPSILEKYESIDFFLHDSEHTFEHMMWEFKTVWPFLKNGGLLISDDVDWNSSFETFANETNSNNIWLHRNKTKKGVFGILIKSDRIKNSQTES